MEEQLRLFDPNEYQDMNGQWNVEVEMSIDEFNRLEKDAKAENMEINDYMVHVIRETLKQECPTCKASRVVGSESCADCGEVD